jgi:hypothetical protein
MTENQRSQWLLSMPACAEITNAENEFTGMAFATSEQHKQAGNSRMERDKFYGRYNDLVCDYKLSLAHMLNYLFHTICYTVISILALTTGNPVYLISTKGARRV